MVLVPLLASVWKSAVCFALCFGVDAHPLVKDLTGMNEVVVHLPLQSSILMAVLI